MMNSDCAAARRFAVHPPEEASGVRHVEQGREELSGRREHALFIKALRNRAHPEIDFRRTGSSHADACVQRWKRFPAVQRSNQDTGEFCHSVPAASQELQQGFIGERAHLDSSGGTPALKKGFHLLYFRSAHWSAHSKPQGTGQWRPNAGKDGVPARYQLGSGSGVGVEAGVGARAFHSTPRVRSLQSSSQWLVRKKHVQDTLLRAGSRARIPHFSFFWRTPMNIRLRFRQ